MKIISYPFSDSFDHHKIVQILSLGDGWLTFWWLTVRKNERGGGIFGEILDEEDK